MGWLAARFARTEAKRFDDVVQSNRAGDSERDRCSSVLYGQDHHGKDQGERRGGSGLYTGSKLHSNGACRVEAVFIFMVGDGVGFPYGPSPGSGTSKGGGVSNGSSSGTISGISSGLIGIGVSSSGLTMGSVGLGISGSGVGLFLGVIVKVFYTLNG